MVHGEAYVLWNGACCAISLLLGGKLAGLSTPKKWRLWGCALAGGGGALGAAVWPVLSLPVLFLCPLLVWICYGENGNTACLRALVTTLCASLLLVGGSLWLTSLGGSPALALALSLLLALLLWTLCLLLPSAFCDVRQVELSYGGQSVLLPAMLDSGNLVRDPFSNLPVVVVSQKAIRPLLPEIETFCALEFLPEGFRLLSVKTAAGSALWPLFRPDFCRLYVNGRAWEAGVMVAVAGKAYGGVQALVPAAAVPSTAAACAQVSASQAV